MEEKEEQDQTRIYTLKEVLEVLALAGGAAMEATSSCVATMQLDHLKYALLYPHNEKYTLCMYWMV